MNSDPLSRLERYHPECSDDGVNPPISDAATFSFSHTDLLKAAFHHEAPGCFLYARSGTSTTRMLAGALAALEGGEAAHVTASGISAIAVTLLQLASAGNQIVASHTIYGGTWALLANVLPRFGIETRFVDTNNIDAVREAITEDTAAIYCETLANPMLRVPDLPALAEVASSSRAALVVDNTFAPLVVSPLDHGADVVVHSLTKYINGASDCVAGAICASEDFIASLSDVADGTAMLLGPVLDSLRAQSIYKNMGTLGVRMDRHGRNALYLAEQLEQAGMKVIYPGLASHSDHDRFARLANPGYGHGGMLALDAGSAAAAEDLARRLQAAEVGLLAVSLGYYRTLFSPSGSSTSSEIPPEMQNQMGLTPGLLRFSIGLDADIEATWERFAGCLGAAGLLV
ncbi:MAG: aminotransferase class I/II-fold pyridoxal phosphate-dependent enzyme [Gammaproteobacteria bacterium]